MIRISVIVPVYNVEPYVKQCITSIISQTERNIEIIVVDDGSSDNSRAILTELAEQDKRIKVICQKNQGVSVARNKGLEVACGEWICFVDGDDMLPSEALSKLLSVAECEKSDICISDYYVMHEDQNQVYAKFILDLIGKTIDYKELVINCMVGNGKRDNVTCVGVPWGKIYKREFLKNNNLRFRPGLKRNQDVVFNLYCFANAKQISYCNQATYCYRVWEGSAVNKYSNNFQKTAEQILELFFEFFSTNICDDDIWEAYERRAILLYYEVMNKQIFHPDNKGSFVQRYREYKELQNSRELSLNKRSDKVLTSRLKIDRWMINHRLVFVSFVCRVIKRCF